MESGNKSYDPDSQSASSLSLSESSLQAKNALGNSKKYPAETTRLTSTPGYQNGVLKKTSEEEKVKGSEKEASEKSEPEVAHPHKKRVLGVAFAALLCYICVTMALGTALHQYLYKRFSHNYLNSTNGSHSSVSCSSGDEDDNDTMAEARNRVQTETSQMSLYLDFTTYVPTLFLCLFMGSYSDYLGRRILVLLSLGGCFVKTILFLLIVALELNLNFFYLAYLLEGLFGAVYGLQLGIVAATSDVTTSTTDRALSFAFLEATLAIAGAFAQVSTGLLISTVGFIGPAILCVSLIFIALVLVLFFMPETLRRTEKVVLNPIVHLRKVFGFYVLEGSALLKGVFWCGLLISIFTAFSQMGRMMVETLYVLNAPFCWNSLKIGVFGGVRQFVTVIGGIFILKVLQKYVSHVTIGIIAMVSATASFILEAFATSDWMMYLVPVLGIAFMCSLPVVRLLMSKLAPSDRQGAVFSSMAFMDTICHLTSSTIYTNVYTSTLKTFPGAVFLVIAAFCLITAGLYVVFQIASKKLPKEITEGKDQAITVTYDPECGENGKSFTKEEHTDYSRL